MTGEKLWDQYQYYTRDLTEHGRKLGFAGCAICWVFKNDKYTFPFLIYLALLAFIVYFISDIMQGLLGALFVRFFTEYKEKELWINTNSIEGDIAKPRWVDLPSFISFILKCMFLFAGFFFLGLELVKRLKS